MLLCTPALTWPRLLCTLVLTAAAHRWAGCALCPSEEAYWPVPRLPASTRCGHAPDQMLSRAVPVQTVPSLARQTRCAWCVCEATDAAAAAAAGSADKAAAAAAENNSNSNHDAHDGSDNADVCVCACVCAQVFTQAEVAAGQGLALQITHVVLTIHRYLEAEHHQGAELFFHRTTKELSSSSIAASTLRPSLFLLRSCSVLETFVELNASVSINFALLQRIWGIDLAITVFRQTP
eukprot:997800-Rhodomonas_salina.1